MEKISFTNYNCAGGICTPINPYIIEVKGNFTVVNEQKKSEYLAFETWLSTQPEIHTSARDGIYNVNEFEPVKTQVLIPSTGQWNTIDDGYHYKGYEHRQWLELKPAGEMEVESECPICGYENDCDCPQPDEQPGKVGEEKELIKTDNIYRPHWVNEDYLKSLGYELVSDKDGYIKYQSSWILKAKHRDGRTFEQLLGDGKRFVYFNCTYVPQDDLVFCCIREDADTRTVYNGVLTEASQLELILKLVE